VANDPDETKHCALLLKSIPTKVPTLWLSNAAFRDFEARKSLKKLAPQVGLEPTTLRLTAEHVVAASRGKHNTYMDEMSI
jgi:hypothetical protein